MTSTLLKTENEKVTIALLPIDELKPHEKGSPLYLELLKQEILRDGMLKYPIIADEKTHVILDGMHRWLALKGLGYSRIPVILVNALQDPKIHVGTRRIHRYTTNADHKISLKRVLSAGISGRLMKPRSTRHFFPFSKFHEVNYPLHRLGKNNPKDISKYLAKMNPQECTLAIKEWLDEISEELEYLTKRKNEVEKEMTDFLNRTKKLNNTLHPI
ncbi:MAG: ParB N-terminal domain-containing protein [Candidatus Bathyarchaeia archaeon]|nr:ParB N-terminal domain-containing protein [Candidatus Bathyarchaeota archaeon A05DMB-4]MDH7595962.1 ParB N-terminal domain-containing protein [Candidatus Bathyarchaeota archaeon]